MDELTRGTRCAKDLVGRDNSGFTVKGLNTTSANMICLTVECEQNLLGIVTVLLHTGDKSTAVRYLP